MIGGQGQKVLLKFVAKHADMWNVPGASAERYAELLKVISSGTAIQSAATPMKSKRRS